MIQIVSSDYFDLLKFGKNTCFKYNVFKLEKVEKVVIWRRDEDKASPLIMTICEKKIIFSWKYLKKDVYFNRTQGGKVVEFIEKILIQKIHLT